MNTIVFQKLQLNLNCCTTEKELMDIFMKVYSDNTLKTLKDDESRNSSSNNNIEIVILLDHVLD